MVMVHYVQICFKFIELNTTYKYICLLYIYMKLNNIFVTTIERSKEHREENLKRIGEFGKKYFDIDVAYGGVDGTKISQQELINLIRQNIIRPSKETITSIDEMIFMPGFSIQRYLSGSEIGCFLSHLNFWGYIVKNGIECSLILEDDANFEEIKFSEQINHIIKNTLEAKKYSYVSLFKHPKQKDVKPYLPCEDDFYNKVDARSWGTVSYIITLEGAKKMLELSCPIRFPVDYTLNSIMEKENIGLIVKNSLISLYDNNSFITGDPISRQGNQMVNKPPEIPPPEVKSVSLIDEIAQFYVVTIDRYRQHRKSNIESTEKYVKEHFNKDIKQMGLDSSKLTQVDMANLIVNKVISVSENGDSTLQDKNRLIFMPQFKRFLKSGEIGCFMSHYMIWKDMIENKVPYAVVLEDDAGIDQEKFKDKLDIIMANAPQGFTSISLYKHTQQEEENRPFIEYNEHFYLVDPETWSTVGYLISLRGAIEFTKNILPIKFPVDYSMHKYGFEKQSSYLYKERILNLSDDISLISKKNISNIDMKIERVFIINEKKKQFDYNKLFTDVETSSCVANKKLPDVKELISNNLIQPNNIRNDKIWLEFNNREMTQDELRQYIMHVSVWQTIINEELSCALVLESDIKPLDDITNTAIEINRLLAKRPLFTDVIFLSRNSDKNILKCNEDFNYTVKEDYGIDAYIITYRGAQKLLKNHAPIRCCMEDFMHNECVMDKTGYQAKFPVFESSAKQKI